MRRTCTVVLAAALSWTVSAPGAQASQRMAVHGSWQSLLNCLFTSYDVQSTQMNCLGSTVWTGDLRGITTYEAKGSYDVLSGDSEGTLHETFYGQDQAGDRGTISFDERYRLDGAASTIHIEVTVVGGTDDFARVAGSMTFDGTDNVATGFGTYGGTLLLRKVRR